MNNNAKQILNDIIEQRRAESMPEVSLQSYFEIFAAEQITKNFSLTFDEIEAGIVDGEHDGGIDSVYTFINGDLIHEDSDIGYYKKNVQIDLMIIQSKTAGGFSEDPLNKLKASLGNMLDLTKNFESLSQYNQQVKDATDLFRQAYRGLASRYPQLNISIFYAAMRADSVIHPNLEIKRDELISSVREMFEDAKVNFEFLGARELLGIARKTPNETFILRIMKPLPTENGYIVLVKLSDYNSFLRNDEEKVRQDLFDSNIRDYQGSTEVNDDINKTLQNPNGIEFWWLNNGITILASRATITGNSVTIENPQIVNGLQTSSQIAKFFDGGGSDDSRMAMIKIIASEDEAVRDQIIKATNSQNFVPLASLRATDKVQRDIEHTLKMGGYFYDRRKNFYKNEGRPAGKIVGIPLLAQAMMTLIRGEPDNARARPSSLIKEDSVYNALFSEGHPVDSYLVAADLVKRIEHALKSRLDIIARDRNNIRFYCLYWVAGWACKSKQITAEKLSKINGKVTEQDIHNAIDLVLELFESAGKSDQVAKGVAFKTTISDALEEAIKRSFAPSINSPPTS